MTTSALEEDLRLTVYDPGVTSLSGTVDFARDASEISAVETLGGTRAKPLQAKAESLDWVVRVLDLNDAMTGELFGSGGRPRILNRLAQFELRTDGGAYENVAVGRITGVRQTENVREYELRFSDEGHLLRTTKAFGPDGFGGVDTCAIYPRGLVDPWRNASALVGLFYDVEEDPGDGSIRLDLVGRNDDNADSRGVDKLSASMKRLIEEDLKPSASFFNFSRSLAEGRGDFENLRWHDVAHDKDYEVFAPGDLTRSFEEDDGFSWPWESAGDTKVVDAKDRPKTVWIYDPDNDYASGDAGNGYLYMPTHEPTDDLPKHFGGESGVHAWQHVKDGLDAAGVRYDTTALNNLIGTAFRIWPRVTSNPSMGEYLRRQVLIPLGYMLVPKANGELTPVQTSLPYFGDVPDVTALPELTESTVRGPEYPSWEHTRTEQKTVVRWRVRHAYTFITEGKTKIEESGSSAADVFAVNETTREQEHDRAGEFGRDVIEYELSGLQRFEEYERVIKTRSEALLQRYGDGAIRSRLGTLSTHESVEAGDWLLVNIDAFPDGSQPGRGGTRLMQAVERGKDLRPGVTLALVDAGPDMQPLNTPSVSLSQHTNDPEHTLDATVSSLDASAGLWELQVAESATDPADSSDLWETAGTFPFNTTTVQVENKKAGTTYWARARALGVGRIGSDWSTHASATTASESSITGLSVGSITGSEALASWTVGDEDLPVLVVVTNTTTSTEEIRTRLPAGSAEYLIRGLSASDGYEVSVRHVRGDSLGPATTATFTAGSTNDTLPAPDYIGIQYGRAEHRGGTQSGSRTGIVPYTEPRDSSVPLVFERAPDDGSGNPDTANSTEIEVPPGTGRLVDDGVDLGGNSGNGYWYRTLHRSTGYDDSPATEWAKAWPVVLPDVFGPQPRTPLVDIDVRVADSGSVSLFFDGEPSVKAFRYDVGTSGFGSLDPSTGTLATTDSAGDKDVSGVTTISKGAVVYVEVEAYSDAAGENSPIAFRSSTASRAGTQTAVAVTPEARLREGTAADTEMDVDLWVQAGADVANPAIRYQTRIVEVGATADWSGWTAVADGDLGTWLSDEITSVGRDAKFPRLLEVQVQDQAPSSNPTTTQGIPIRPQVKGLDGNDGSIDAGQTPGGGYSPPRGSPKPWERHLDQGYEGPQNLLGPDAGPEQLTDGGYLYLDKEPIGNLGLSVGDVVSLSLNVWSNDGSENVWGIIRFFDSSDSLISDHDTPHIQSTTPQREVVENVTVPANTATITVRAFRGTGDSANSRRAMLNRGSIAHSFVEPPARVQRGEVSPTFDWIKLQKVEDDSTDDTYFVDWQVNEATGTILEGWRVTVRCFREGTAVVSDTVGPRDGPIQIVHSGGGDGASNTHSAEFRLWEDLIADVGDRIYERAESEDVSSSDVSGSAPANLSAAFRTVPCDVDLSWDADAGNSQDIYRCSGSGCDPVVDGSKVADVAAGTSSHSDDVSGVPANTMLTYAVQSSAGTSNEASTFRSSC